MVTLDNLITRAEEQEGSSAVCALGLSLFETLVPNERCLLVAHESANGHACERPIRHVAVNL